MPDHDPASDDKRRDGDPEWSQPASDALRETRPQQVVFQEQEAEKRQDDEIGSLNGFTTRLEEGMNGGGEQRRHAAAPRCPAAKGPLVRGVVSA